LYAQQKRFRLKWPKHFRYMAYTDEKVTEKQTVGGARSFVITQCISGFVENTRQNKNVRSVKA